MREENTNVLVKSEKTSQKKKKGIIWAVSILMIIAALSAFIIDYSGYKKGQEFGLESAVVVSEICEANLVSQNDSYKEQCEDLYYKLSKTTYDMTLNGRRYDMSDVRKSERALRSAFYDVMEAGGFDRYYDVAEWFKYTNIAEYFTGYYWSKSLPVCCYIVLLFSIIFTILVNRESKKELIVYEDSVLCRVNSKKSKQLVFEDIKNVDFGKKTLKIVGTGIKFKISNLTNAESIKSLIIEKKKSAQNKFDSVNFSNADELKKYKDLLDSGVITQEEFDAKKKQLLGL